MQRTQTIPLDLQSAIYGAALSLDAFLLNGIQFGLLPRIAFGDFLQQTAGNLLRDLDTLDEQTGQALKGEPEIPGVLSSIRSRCRMLIGLVMGLRSFRSLPLPEVRLAVSQIAPLRAQCVRLIEDLEACLDTSKPFYRSRPERSTEAIDDFLSKLEPAFVEEWTASNSVDPTA